MDVRDARDWPWRGFGNWRSSSAARRWRPCSPRPSLSSARWTPCPSFSACGEDWGQRWWPGSGMSSYFLWPVFFFFCLEGHRKCCFVIYLPTKQKEKEFKNAGMSNVVKCQLKAMSSSGRNRMTTCAPLTIFWKNCITETQICFHSTIRVHIIVEKYGLQKCLCSSLSIRFCSYVYISSLPLTFAFSSSVVAVTAPQDVS